MRDALYISCLETQKHQRPAVIAALSKKIGLTCGILDLARPQWQSRKWFRLKLLAMVATNLVEIPVAIMTIHRLKPRCIYLQNGGLISFLLAVILKPTQTKVIIDMVDYFGTIKGHLETRLRGRLELFTLRIADGAIFVSLSQRLRATDKLGKEYQSTWIPYGMSPEAATLGSISRQEARANIGIASNAFVATWSGGLWLLDGKDRNGLVVVGEALDALAQVHQRPVVWLLNGLTTGQVACLGIKLRYAHCKPLGEFRWGDGQHRDSLRSADVLLLPAESHPAIEYAHRAKLYDYLAAGRYILASATVEMRHFASATMTPIHLVERNEREFWYDAFITVASLGPERDGLGRKMTEVVGKEGEKGAFESRLQRLLEQVGVPAC